jgi:hypothetical protein
METGDYIDNRGRLWRCVAQKEFGRMVCYRDDGSHTAASEKTWKRWNWKPAQSADHQ